ncbi:MAG: type I methionyl aminopeptidase, partial [Candidatus Omnitrophica bacterium]|nr:type I methionyl aminopeptidase [Candidatus Omnitrophota bacterium]
MIIIKSKEELLGISESGRVLAKIMEVLKNNLKVGMTTKELDQLAERLIREENAEPAFLGYQGFPNCL